MSVLCDRIEQFIVGLIEESQGQAEVKRNQLAEQFGCAPSQISYVISTRFCPLRGYVVQSRRGGGGYIRIMRVDIERAGYIANLVHNELADPIGMRRAEEIVRGLATSGCISEKEVPLMLAAVSPKALRCAGENEDEVRAHVLSSMLLQCIDEEF